MEIYISISSIKTFLFTLYSYLGPFPSFYYIFYFISFITYFEFEIFVYIEKDKFYLKKEINEKIKIKNIQFI